MDISRRTAGLGLLAYGIGTPVVFGEGGASVAGMSHDVVYALSSLSMLVAVPASAFLVGTAALLLAARAPLPAALRVLTVVGGVAGLLAGFFFPVALFWLWAIVLGGRTIAAGTRTPAPIRTQHQPV